MCATEWKDRVKSSSALLPSTNLIIITHTHTTTHTEHLPTTTTTTDRSGAPNNTPQKPTENVKWSPSISDHHLLVASLALAARQTVQSRHPTNTVTTNTLALLPDCVYACVRARWCVCVCARACVYLCTSALVLCQIKHVNMRLTPQPPQSLPPQPPPSQHCANKVNLNIKMSVGGNATVTESQ